MEDGIATVTVHLTARYGTKIMPLCEKVQENVKQTIQNMTGITVARVDVQVVGLAEHDKETTEERQDRNLWTKSLPAANPAKPPF